MESYLYRQFPHHLQGLLACTSNTNAFPQLYSSADTTSGTRYHPYMYTSNYSRGHLSSNGSDPYGFGSCFQLTASVHSGTNKNQQTMSDDVFSRLSLSREDLSQYFASDISQLSTLKTLQDVCGLGVASTCLNNAAWLSGNATPKLTQTSVKQSTCSEINGGNVDHPFYNRRRRATSSEEGLTRTRDKYRVVYTDKQRKGLEKAYEENKFITMETRNKLSKELDLSDRQIKIWFQNRRAKERRDLKRSSDAESSTSDSDHSNSSDFIDSASMTPSCRFGGNKNEYTKNTLPIAHYHNETGTNTTTDPFFGYQTVPSFIDSQPMFCSYSSSHGDLHYVDHTPLDIYSSFPTGRL